MIAVIIVNEGRKGRDDDKDQVSQCCLATLLLVGFQVGPVVIQVLTFSLIYFKHRAINHPNHNLAHEHSLRWVGRTFKEALFDYVKIYELLQEPRRTLRIIIHISLQIPYHLLKRCFVVCSLTHGVVERSRKFKHVKLAS